MLSSNFRSFISILAILGLLVQATGAQAALTIVSVTRTGAPTATGALFGNQIDVLVSSPVILSGSIGARVLSGTVAGTSLTTQVSESMSGANFQYLLRSPALTTLATQGSGSVSVSGLGAS